jgi:hypothetical protein
LPALKAPSLAAADAMPALKAPTPTAQAHRYGEPMPVPANPEV